MFDLKIKLNKNTNYINTWNILSKLSLIKNNFKNEENTLFVVEDEKSLNNYLKINDFLWYSKLKKIESIGDLVELIYNKNWYFISTIELFTSKIDKVNQIKYNDIFKLEEKQEIILEDITKKLNSFNYKFWEFEENNSFFVKWDTLNIKNSLWDLYKVIFWWNTIEEINKNDKKIKTFFIWNNKNLDFENNNWFNNELINEIIENEVFIVIDSLDFKQDYDNISKWLNNFIIFNSISNNQFAKDLEINDLYINNIEELKDIITDTNKNIFIITKNIKTIKSFLELNNISNINLIESSLNILKSFKTPILKNKWNIIICDDNISRIFIKKRLKRSFSKDLDLLLQIKPWDYIVHIDHWIWIFDEIIEKDLSWIKKEYISIIYKNNDKLFVPISEISRVSKYIWIENPKLTWLSTNEWEKKLKKPEKMLKKLLKIY